MQKAPSEICKYLHLFLSHQCPKIISYHVKHPRHHDVPLKLQSCESCARESTPIWNGWNLSPGPDDVIVQSIQNEQQKNLQKKRSKTHSSVKNPCPNCCFFFFNEKKSNQSVPRDGNRRPRLAVCSGSLSVETSRPWQSKSYQPWGAEKVGIKMDGKSCWETIKKPSKHLTKSRDIDIHSVGTICHLL